VTNGLECTIADQNAASTTSPAGWLSLDENDSDLNISLGYFIAALHTFFKDICNSTLALVQAQQLPHAEVIYATFIIGI
jgi:ATP/maltotriose-dependent transcriptional regulator MalT